MPFYLKKGDLVEAKVDAIVNASNVNLKMVEGVGRAIFHKAGDKELTKACKEIGGCKVGEAVITPSFNLTNCKSIIHAVGPIYINGKHGELKALRLAYLNSLRICEENGYTSVAFPLLSGEFNFPLKECYAIAEDILLKYLEKHPDMEIYMIMFKNFPDMMDEEFRKELTKYIIDNFQSKETKVEPPLTNEKFVKELNKILKENNISEEELIKNSNITSALYNKIKEDKTYIPSRNLCLALAVGSHSTLIDLNVLLESIGYTVINDNVGSLVVSFFINKGIYDVYKINFALFNYEIDPLGLEN